MVKLEVVDEGNDELIQYLDDIFSGLMHGGGKYNLTHLEDTDYNAKTESALQLLGQAERRSNKRSAKKATKIPISSA